MARASCSRRCSSTIAWTSSALCTSTHDCCRGSTEEMPAWTPPTGWRSAGTDSAAGLARTAGERCVTPPGSPRSEEHTSELQSQFHLVCRLLLEKKKKKIKQSKHRNRKNS